jgi:hypothetical protein
VDLDQVVPDHLFQQLVVYYQLQELEGVRVLVGL